jgi:hypothetical protein
MPPPPPGLPFRNTLLLMSVKSASFAMPLFALSDTVLFVTVIVREL